MPAFRQFSRITVPKSSEDEIFCYGPNRHHRSHRHGTDSHRDYTQTANAVATATAAVTTTVTVFVIVFVSAVATAVAAACSM